VIAAAEYVNISLNREYLAESIAGKSVLDRMESALEYVWMSRRDEKTGLVVGAHTIDWGDVQIGGETHKQAVYLNEKSTLTVDIYDNALYCLAIRSFLSLLPPAIYGRGTRDEKWRQRLDFLRAQTKKVLWDEGRGYFVMHRHVTPLDHDFDEDSMFPMGGNAVAIEAGLTDRLMTRRIAQKVFVEQRRHGAATISGVLYPPYNDGIYLHPTVNKAYQYQNGGLWDWFGLRMVRALYKHGYKTEAKRAFLEIAAKVVKNKTFSEWDALDGSARGSRDYLGAAGQYIAAVSEMRESFGHHERSVRRAGPIR
jgi:hypothetical protein